VLSVLWRVPPVSEGAARLAIAQVDPVSVEKIVDVKCLNQEGFTYATAEILLDDKTTWQKAYRIHIREGVVESLENGNATKLGQVDVTALEKKGGSRGFGENTKLPAPQAGALKGMIEGVKSGNAPVDKYVTGGVMGALLTLLPISGLGVMMGLAMYLPFSITLGYGIGCLGAIGLENWKGGGWCEDKVVPFAAGLIIGEAMTALVFNIWQIFCV
jgi:hypothetical protein